jgi:hypothetical protein
MDIKKVIGSVMEYGGFQKIDGNSNRVLAIGALILSYLAVIMKETQLLTRLCVVIEALFFGQFMVCISLEWFRMKSIQNMFFKSRDMYSSLGKRFVPLIFLYLGH